MLINKKNGEITLGEIELSPNLSLSEFKKTVLIKSSKPLVNNPTINSYSMKDIHFKLERIKYKAGIIILFKDKKINKVIFNFIEEGEEIPQWDQEKEEQRKLFYDDLLIKILGKPPYIYSWGKVESYYDPKSCSSGIIVSYYNAISKD